MSLSKIHLLFQDNCARKHESGLFVFVLYIQVNSNDHVRCCLLPNIGMLWHSKCVVNGGWCYTKSHITALMNVSYRYKSMHSNCPFNMHQAGILCVLQLFSGQINLHIVLCFACGRIECKIMLYY